MSISEQCHLLGVSRSWYYYMPKRRESSELAMLKHETRRAYLHHSYYGYRRIANELDRKGIKTSEKQIRTLMDKMGLKAIHPKPSLSTPSKEHKIYPYLLDDIEVTHPNHVWASDITYLRLGGSFVYLVAIIDLFSRKVLSWQISNTMDAGFCADALKKAIRVYGSPEIFNTDQGSQFTSNDFTSELIKNKIRISMDGKGRALDNVYIERLWRSLKYEDIYIKDYRSLKELKGGVSSYFKFYNTERYHQSLMYRTPDEVYFGTRPKTFVTEMAA